MVVGSQSTGCQVAVIGGGPGGYLAALRLAKLGKDVACIEANSSLGGVCLNEGCIPSKALIHAADFYHDAKHADQMGIEIGRVDVNLSKMVQWKDKIVDKLTGGIGHLFKRHGVQRIKGTARFENNRELAVDTANGVKRIEFEQAVIATGTVPVSVPGLEPDGENVIGSREALDLDEVPDKLVVIGGGYIGLELGTVYAKLGAEVTIVELLPKLLPMIDDELRRILMNRLDELDINVLITHKAESWTAGEPNTIKIQNSEGERVTLEADQIIVSVGRQPNTEGLNLDAVGVELDDDGFVSVDAQMRTTADDIYAIGDVAGGPQLAHKAYREGHVVAEVLTGQPSAFDNQVVPAVIFTDPEIAWTGFTEEEAREEGYDVATASFPFRASGRALSLNAPRGLVKIVSDKESNRILGVHLIGRDVSELVGEASFAIEMGAFLEDLAMTIHPHPTMSEGLMEAAENALGHGVHSG